MDDLCWMCDGLIDDICSMYYGLMGGGKVDGGGGLGNTTVEAAAGDPL